MWVEGRMRIFVLVKLNTDIRSPFRQIFLTYCHPCNERVLQSGDTNASPLMQKLTWTVNAARRFRYTLDFEKHEQQLRLKSDPAARLRAGTHVIRVCAPTPHVLPAFGMPPTNIVFLQASGNIWQVGVWSSWYILQTFWVWIVPSL